MERAELVNKILGRLDQITRKSQTVAPDKLEQAVFLRLDQVEKIVSSIERYLPRRIIDKILLNPEGTQVEGERRPVTILFGDLSGFTSMSETMDPEQVVEVVNQYFDTMVEIASRYGGHIDKFMGDALMVLFGAPVVHEDDALRACLAAIEMLEAMDRFAAERKMDLAMSIGLNSGEVVALNVGSKERMEYTVIGDAVNLAARLEKVASARECVIGENTYKRVKGKIRLKKLKPVMVKGKSKPQNVYLILGRMEAEEKAGALRSGSIKMVGRQAEMDAIRGSIQKVRSGSGQIVAITGDPGLGKSRLAKELELLAREENFRFAKGKCYSYSSGVAYLPFLRQLCLLMGIQEKDSPGKKREALSAGLQTLDLSDLEPFLGSLLGISYPEIENLDPEKRKRKTFEGFQLLFQKESERQPLALAFEDLQWADSLSLELLEHLADKLAGQPVMICCDYRPELALPFIARANCLSLVLKPLDQREMFQMMASMSGVADVSDQVLDKVAARTEGNPLFIEEITQHLLSRRLVKREANSLLPAKRFGAMALPNTVAGVVLGRIDKLSEELRRTLQYAAVIGREFDHDMLGHITKTGPDQLQRQLDDLEHSEGLLYSKMVEGKRLYQFHSTTTQEAAYGTLLKERRRVLHGGVAQTYERDYHDNLEPWLEDLAHHYYHSKFEDKAVLYLHKAGDKARGLYANAEAIEFYEKGIGVLKKAKDTRENKLELAEVLWVQSIVLRLMGEREKALSNCNIAIRYAKKNKDIKSTIKYELSVGILYDMLGNIQEAKKIWQNILDNQLSNESDRARALQNIGNQLNRSGDVNGAITAFRKALDIMERNKEYKEIVRLHRSLGLANEHMNMLKEAENHYLMSLNLAKEHRFIEEEAFSYNHVGSIYLALGDYVRAHQNLENADKLAIKIGDKRVESLASGNLGMLDIINNDFSHGLDYFTKSLTAAYEISDRRQQMLMLINIGCVKQTWGDNITARESHVKAHEIAKQYNDALNLAEIKRNLGFDLIGLGYYNESLSHFTESYQQAKNIGDQRTMAFAKAGIGMIYHLTGNLAQAGKTINESLNEAKAVKDPEVILAAARGLTEYLMDQNDLESAQQHMERRLGLSEKTGNKREFAYALLNLVELHVLKNDFGAVAKEFSEAMTIAREIKDKILIGRLSLAAARGAIQVKKDTEAEGYLRDALEAAEKSSSPELLWQVYYCRSKLFDMKEDKEQAGRELGNARKVITEMENGLPEDLRKGFIENTPRKLAFK